MMLKAIKIPAYPVIALLLAGVMLPAGCRNDGPPTTPPAVDTDEETAENESGTAVPAEEITVEIYFADREATESGTTKPSLGYTLPVSRKVPHEQDTVLLLKSVMAELMAGPGQEDSGVSPVIPEGARLLDITLENGVAYINFSQEVMYTGGTLGGAVFMQAVILTATQFPKVKYVQVLMDGEPWCDGHFIWEEPLGRDSLPLTG